MELSKNQVSFLRVRQGSKNMAWATVNGVVWSTDGQHLFATESKKGGLFNGDLSDPSAEMWGHRLIRIREGRPVADYQDPTKIISRPSEDRFVLESPALFAETLRKSSYIKWADRLGFLPVGQRTFTKDPTHRLGYHFCYVSPITGAYPFAPHRSLVGTQTGGIKEPFELDTKVIKKILRTMAVSRIMITGTSYRDPVYFYGKVDGSNAIAVVSPIK